MPIIEIFITLIIVGIILWAINTYIPMAAPIKKILNVAIIIVICLWLLQSFGLIGSLNNLQLR